jgi:hypothetical protein
MKAYSNTFFVDYVETEYPFIGSRINFNELKNSLHYKIDNANIFERIKTIVVANKLNTEEHIIYIGDNLLCNIYEFRLKHLIELLPSIMEIPQHHYFFAIKSKWCICISFENDLEFGSLE